MREWNWLGRWPDNTGWKYRHLQAMQVHPVGVAVRAWCEYAAMVDKEFGHQIGQDTALRDHWAAWGEGLRRLLDGPTGGLDAGTVCAIIEDNLTAQGWDVNVERWLDETDCNGTGNGVAG